MQGAGVPWVLVISKSPKLSADLVVRGSFPINVVHLVNSKMSAAALKEYSGDVTAAVSRCDGMARINYLGNVIPNLADTFFNL